MLHKKDLKQVEVGDFVYRINGKYSITGYNIAEVIKVTSTQVIATVIFPQEGETLRILKSTGGVVGLSDRWLREIWKYCEDPEDIKQKHHEITEMRSRERSEAEQRSQARSEACRRTNGKAASRPVLVNTELGICTVAFKTEDGRPYALFYKAVRQEGWTEDNEKVPGFRVEATAWGEGRFHKDNVERSTPGSEWATTIFDAVMLIIERNYWQS